MSAICNTSLGWIYMELMKKIKILELPSDEEFLYASFHVNSYFSIAALNHRCSKRQMCQIKNRIRRCPLDSPNKPRYEI